MYKIIFRSCFVPNCLTTSYNSPEKIFLTVPSDETRRKKWCEVITERTNERFNWTKSRSYYICEDHFNLEKDCKNFEGYCKTGLRIHLKKDAVPHIFNVATSSESQIPHSIKKLKFDFFSKLHVPEEVARIASIQNEIDLTLDLNTAAFISLPTLNKKTQSNISRDCKSPITATSSNSRENENVFKNMPTYPQPLYYFIELLSKHTQLPELNIIITLKWIRLGKRNQLGNDFDLSTTNQVLNIFYKLYRNFQLP